MVSTLRPVHVGICVVPQILLKCLLDLEIVDHLRNSFIYQINIVIKVLFENGIWLILINGLIDRCKYKITRHVMNGVIAIISLSFNSFNSFYMNPGYWTASPRVVNVRPYSTVR